MTLDFYKDSIDKQIKIEFDGGTITNTEIHQEQFELSESLCSESQLKFGCCETGSIKFRISNVFEPLKDKWLTVSMTLERNRQNPFVIGQYKVVSDVPTANRKYREVTAYDSMYDINNADVAAWYNVVLPNTDSKVTLKEFRDSFFQYFEIEQEDVSLPQDSMVVKKTIDPSEISGKDVITAICELNGRFGHIGRDGKFYYVYLGEIIEGLYPRNDLYPQNEIYPAEPGGAVSLSGSYYITAQYEDYRVRKINKLQIRQKENDIGYVVGYGNNCYIVEDNFLVYGKNNADLKKIAEILYEQIKRVWYQPASVSAMGNPMLTVGDGIRLRTRHEIIYTYILERTLKGIQALRDEYSARGKEYYSEKANSVNRSIVQLRGKTNELTRTVEETNSRLTDTAASLETEISQTASEIRTEVKNTADGLSSRITQNANEIDLRVTKNGVVSAINLSPEAITISASKINVNGLLATTQFQAQTARITNLEAADVTINGNISAVSARVGNLEADHVTVNNFNALSGRVGSIESDYITTGELNAVSARVGNLEADHVTTVQLNAVDVKFNNLNADNITAGSINGSRVVINNARLHSSTSVMGSLSWNNNNIGTARISGYTVLVFDND